MEKCTVEDWTLKELAEALQDEHKGKKRIAVPMFQRGKRWKKNQQETFIDSLLKGFPVGTMLFHEEKDEDGKLTYILIDGLQRGNCIRKYMNNPTDFFYDSTISDDFCHCVLKKVEAEDDENYPIVREILTSFIKSQKSFKNLQYFNPASKIAEHFNKTSLDIIGELLEIIKDFFEQRQSLYDQIASTIIPVVIYHGSEENLPEIFDRINSQGTPLDQYEVYAASWPVNRRMKIENIDIVEAAIKKYDTFIEDGFVIQGYDRETMRSSKELNAFEYLFGLSKYIVNHYDMLGFQKTLADDTVNTLGFELVNACLNDSDKIKTLYQNIYSLEDINVFEKALYQAIDFVTQSISPIFKFKGNNRRFGNKVFHSKFQILSMISTSFKEMFKNGDFSAPCEAWEEKKDKISKQLRLYYVHDILIKFWSEGGTQKIHNVAKPNRYEMEISPRTWRAALDGFFEKSMSRMEARNIATPKSEEIVMLNCIYLNTFTAMDQLSIDKFDIEHIAPKEQMKELIKKTKGMGLPISCIANLCYLPDYVNRSKGKKNFYQDKNYLKHINLSEVEYKYSFTSQDDLEWMDMLFSEEDFEMLKDCYTEFLNKRFETLKRLFCKSMDIDYEAMQTGALEFDKKEDITVVSDSPIISQIEASIGHKLIKIGRKIYCTEDKKVGYVLTESKAYKQGDRQRYWYGFRKKPLEAIANCEEKYMIFLCRDSDDSLLVPLKDLEVCLPSLNTSEEDGVITHWHIVLLRDKDGHITQLLSKPELKEVDMDKYII